MKTKFFILLFTVTFCIFTIASQKTENPYPTNIQSPNSSNLGKFGDTPVSLYTGTPNITIPFLELKTKEFVIDVSMSYDASGIRVKSHPSWVGQNWSLNAGGVITRSVQGYEDEYPERTDYYGGYNGSAASNITKAGFFTTLGKDSYKILNMEDAPDFNTRSSYDCQPDIFTFNFLGKTGKFWLGNDGDWKVQADWNIDVIFHTFSLDDGYLYMGTPGFLNSNMSKGMYQKHIINTIRGFKLRDDEGNTYIFGFDDTAIEYSIDFFNQFKSGSGNTNYFPAIWRSNAWYLNAVYDKNGNKIFSFYYERGKFIADFFEYKEGTSFSVNEGTTTLTDEERKIKLGGNLISPVYLTSIVNEPNDQYVYFESSASNERPYTNIHYVDYNGSEVFNVGFTLPFGTITDHLYESACSGTSINRYPYLQATDTTYRNSDSYNQDLNPILGLRWRKLNAIHYVSSSGTERDIFDHIKSVRFTYNEGQISNTLRLAPTKIDFEFLNQNYKTLAINPEYSYSLVYNGIATLPNYLSRAYDHWGYCSSPNSSYSNGFLPNDATLSTLTGILTSIKYPTGGVSNFEYELNNADYYLDGTHKYDLNPGNVGGLRIKSITNKNGDEQNTVIKKYFYYEGILKAKPYYSFDWGVPGTLMFHRESMIPIIPLSNYFGSHIEYPKILETIYKNNVKVSSKYYNYSNSADHPDVATYGYGGPTNLLTDRSFMRGKLKSTELQDGNYNIKESTLYTYRDSFDISFDTSFVKASNYSIERPAPIPFEMTDENGNSYTFNYYVVTELGSDYKMYYSNYDVVKEEKRVYTTEDDYVLTKKIYTKTDYAMNLCQDYPLDSRTATVNFRLVNAEEELASDGTKMKVEYNYPFDYSGNEMSILMNKFRLHTVGTNQYKNNVMIGKSKLIYRDFNGLVLPGAFFKADNDLQFLRPETTYDKYDAQGYLLSFTDKNGLKNAIIWDKMTEKPSVLIKNMSYDDVSGLITQEGIDVFALRYTKTNSRREGSLTTLKNQGKNVHIFFYDYSSTGNLLKKVGPNGLGHKYYYDSANRLSAIKTLDDKLLETYDYKYREDPY